MVYSTISATSFASGRGGGLLPLIGLLCLLNAVQAIADEQTVDPTDWGADHVGQNFPEYLTGDECLFCHRNIGPTWDVNPHQRTIRIAIPDDPAIKRLGQADEAAAREVELLFGAKRVVRYLRRSKEYGKLDMLSASYVPEAPNDQASGKLSSSDSVHWDVNAFADRCAGCHATAVNAQSRTFSTVSLDCVTCHGLVELEHTDDVAKVFLSSKNQEPKQVISICGQCHLRGGKSKSSGLPYPNTFVAGDNLFRDFQIDLTDDQIGRLPVVQQHIYLNVRDVVMQGNSSVTCISCHHVHGGGSEKHQDLSDSALCASCHQPNTDNGELLESLILQNEQRTRNKTCDY